MADFVVEFAEPNDGSNNMDTDTHGIRDLIWQVSVDGSSGNQGAGVGVVLEAPDGEEVSYAVRLEFRATNNQTEYEALISGLEFAQTVRANKVKVRAD